MPFLVFGSNSIAAYVLSELLPGILGNIHVAPSVNVLLWIFNTIRRFVPDLAFSALLYSLVYVAICWVPMYVLYRRRIFIKI